jgi:hypothetical protein
MRSHLHDDLVPYLTGHVLRHPLIECDAAYPALFARINRWYNHLRRVESGQYTPNDWDRFHPELDPGSRLARYLEESYSAEMPIEQWLTSERLQFFGQYWTAPEIVAHTSSFWPMVSGLSSDISASMDCEEIELWRQLPDSVRVYRAHGKENLKGCCWYPHPATAWEWAATVPQSGLVSSGFIAKQFVRALFTRNGETELIVNSAHVVEVVTTPVR